MRVDGVCGVLVYGLLGLLVTSCAGAAPAPDVNPEEWRARLRADMREDVPTRDRRDELSRRLVEATDRAALERLTRPDVQAELGSGLSCDGYWVCERQGFAASDWYYLIGHTDNPKIKQLPVLVVGFDPQGRVSRVYALHTH